MLCGVVYLSVHRRRTFGVRRRATFSQEAPPAAADTATQPSQQATEQVVRAHLWNDCLTNPELQGAWVTKWRPYETDNDKTIGFQVTAIVDVAKADRQLELLRRRLAESGLTPTPRIEQSFRLPLNDLLTQVRKQLREKAGQAGCLVGGVVYGPDPSGVGGTDPDAILEVVPFGRTRSAEDTALILDAFREVVNTSAVWQKFVQDSQLQIVVVDRQLGQSSYSETLCQDWEQVRTAHSERQPAALRVGRACGMSRLRRQVRSLRPVGAR